MKIVTFTIPKGGVGKTLLQANVAAALAKSGRKVIILDTDPSRAMETILSAKTGNATLSQVISANSDIRDALYETGIENLYLLPSGLRLEAYLDLNPLKFIKKLNGLECDVLFVDTPFPLSESAFLALGVCHYLVMVLSEDEFSLCVESGIDLTRLARFVFDCKPAGFVVNRLTGDKITDKLIGLIERAFEAPCIARIREDPLVRKSYGGPRKADAHLFFEKFPDSEFSKQIQVIAKFIDGLPEADGKPIDMLERVLKQVKK
ncbi:MAG: MinD/ParA family protein [Thermoproteota archaeon]